MDCHPRIDVSYRLTTSLADDAAVDDLRVLSAPERERCQRFVFPNDRRDFAAAHALLRRRLSAGRSVPAAAWTFEAAPGGKPRIASSGSAGIDLDFNVSHTRGMVACAVARHADVGVDIERIDRAAALGQEVAATCFTDRENEWLDGTGPIERSTRFAELWTLKEAYLKATGTGLTDGLRQFAFAFPDQRGIRFEAAAGTPLQAWTFVLFAPAAGYRLAVAARARSLDSRSPVITLRADDPRTAAGGLVRMSS